MIRERGMSIPEDISIAGYDGIRLAKLTVPNLTTLCQDTQHLGQYAAEKLIDQIEKPKTAMRNITIVQGKLYEGQTVLKLDGSRG